MLLHPDRHLTVCGLEEIAGFRAAGVTHVLSIADPGTPAETYFDGFAPHRRLDLRFHDIIDEMPGHIFPTPDHVAEILEFGEAMALEGESLRHLLVHCHMGVSRSTASMLMLIAQRHPGEEEASVARLAAIRPQAWPNTVMIDYAEAALGTKGRLRDALRPQYRRVRDEQPDLIAMLRRVGRGREIPTD
ncbi:MAG: protein-tyrosine-phosphatase [Inquilinus limosus]|uniref:Protein-tyrosine-phosphatase n=1 Tax=Inquilinus limosus TaxID=171674 RepID=A0A952FTU8_9PROT|nr:protein-tyrosine-phosphatase [Inquilinus limosus]